MKREVFDSERMAVEFMMNLPLSAEAAIRREAGTSRMRFVVEWKEDE